jgi:hypothetical protein
MYVQHRVFVEIFLLLTTIVGGLKHIFKHNQQDATLHNDICYYKCSIVFRRFLRPSSGAQNCIHSIVYLSRFFCFLPLSWMGWNIYSSTTNKMQHYTMIFVTINALHVSGGSSAHHQDLKTVYTASCICRDFSASYRYRGWDGTTHPR